MSAPTRACLLVKRRDDRAGRRCTIGNRVCAKSVPRVRIPISPPEQPRALARNHKDTIVLPDGNYSSKPERPHLKSKRSTPRGGVAEWLNAAVSKTVLPVTRVTRVRIPPPPPVLKQKRPKALFCCKEFCVSGYMITNVVPTCQGVVSTESPFINLFLTPNAAP